MLNPSSRRSFLCHGLLGGLAATAPQAWAQAWPAKPVKMIIPVGPGSAPDVIARLLADKLTALWGQGVIVDNRPGAGGIPGMSALARSPNDGYTLGFVPASYATITPLVYKNPQFNPDTDLLPVATVGVSPLMIVVPASTGLQSLTDLARYAKANPGKVNFAVPQLNSLPHFCGERINQLGAMGMQAVPYPNAPAAVNAVLAGDALMTVDGVPSMLPHVRAGKLKALAVTHPRRLPGLDVPTVAETYPGNELVGWFQVMGLSGLSGAIAEKINADVNRVMSQPDMVARMAELSVYHRPDTPASAKAFFVQEQIVMKKLVTDLGIQPQ